MFTLTNKQKKIYDYTKDYIGENGISPTFEEIRKKFKLKAISTAHEHINALTQKGYLRKTENASRGLEIVEDPKKIIEIPIVGMIAAGHPIETIENHEENVYVASSELAGTDKHYALRVSGSSMIDEGIFDGDIVVIKKQTSAENGQTVVAIIDEEKATLKKIFREKGRVRLQPANQNLLPFYVKNLEIRGVVVKIIRNMQSDGSSTKASLGLRTIDLFAGVGGIRMGFEKAGFKTVFANDFEKNCKLTYDANFKDSKLIIEDIRNISIDDLPDFDFLLAGFPCQAFSIAGYRQGFKDQKGRGNLFFDIARIIEVRKPRGFLLENVKNLKSHDSGRTFNIIEKTLSDLGYHIKVKVLNSMDYGDVPQNRERIYIVGFSDKKHIDNFNFPDAKKLTTKVTDLLETSVPEKYYYNGKPLFKRLKPYIKDEGKVYQWRRQYVRENKKGVCPTLTANMGTGGHNVPIIKDKHGIRKLMPIECARIQGFPASYKLPGNIGDSALYKQFGNSVTVSVIERIAHKIQEAIC